MALDFFSKALKVIIDQTSKTYKTYKTYLLSFFFLLDDEIQEKVYN